MELNKYTVNEEKTEQGSMLNTISSQIVNTQKAIRNKFEKSCMNRLEHEHDVIQAMKPLVSIRSSSLTSTPIPNENPNELCNRLRVLLDADDLKHADEINLIVMKLRELEILI